MFKNKEDLYDFLLTNDFNDKRSDIEYKFILLSFREMFRNIHSENSNLKRIASEKDEEITLLKSKNDDTVLKLTIAQHYIKNLKNKLSKCRPWYKRIFKK